MEQLFVNDAEAEGGIVAVVLYDYEVRDFWCNPVKIVLIILTGHGG